jgi:hypothetical protein
MHGDMHCGKPGDRPYRQRFERVTTVQAKTSIHSVPFVGRRIDRGAGPMQEELNLIFLWREFHICMESVVALEQLDLR